MKTRRSFLSNLTRVSALAFLPLETRLLFAESSATEDTLIDAVDVLRISGPYSSSRNINRQHQAQPLHIYPEHRPEPYQDPTNPKPFSGTMTHHYIRIRTKGGIEGIYGYLDPETITPILKQLRSFLIGKDALAVETIWDQLYRRNRHARAGHYMSKAGFDG